MKNFAHLINQLDSTNKTNQKISAIEEYFKVADSADKLWVLALFTGKRPKRAISTTLLKQWVIELSNIPEWLFLEAYSSVGDLAETISLILPPADKQIEKPLHVWMADIEIIRDKPEEEKKKFIIDTWNSLSITERFVFNKLIGGSFRLGVSSKIIIKALAQLYKLEPSSVAHSILGDWNKQEIEFDKLILGEYSNTNLSKPYPFCLAYPIEDLEKNLQDISLWQIEYKWDGIRGQIIKRKDEVFIWSRGEELINSQFPELISAIQELEGDFVIDAEILPYLNGEILNFSKLQKRLNRKNLTTKILEEIPVILYVYDLLELSGTDIRTSPLSERRKILEELFTRFDSAYLKITEVFKVKHWSEIESLRDSSKEINSEGLMIKKLDSEYMVGRKRGAWWKWKIDPMTIDAVLIYAQRGSGRRSGYYTDYTFAVKDGDKLVTIAKAYSGLSNNEIQEVSKFVNKNAIEKFGPVRTVKPELVFEIAFEGISLSNRHKSGVALRFPRILRWRKDKTVNDIDDISEIKKLIKE